MTDIDVQAMKHAPMYHYTDHQQLFAIIAYNDNHETVQ